jgi:hypothetical protein
MSERWEVSYGYIGAQPTVIQYQSEEEAEAVARELQATHFAGSSNWTINSRRVGAGE